MDIQPGGIWLPASFPWLPTTQEGRMSALHIIAVAQVISPTLGWLGVTLLLGALWSRVVRSQRICWAVALVPSAGVVQHLVRQGLVHLYVTGPHDPPDWVYFLVWHQLPSVAGAIFSCVLALLLLGAFTLLFQRARPLRAA